MEVALGRKRLAFHQPLSLWNVGRAGARRSQVDGQHRSRSQRDAPSTPQRPHVCKALASWEEPAGGQYRRGGLASLSLRSRKADGTFWGGGGRPSARVSDDRPVMAALAMYGSQSPPPQPAQPMISD